MERQHTENLFRRFKGELVNIKTISGGVYRGYVSEITNDYVSIVDREAEDEQTFLLFSSIESLVVITAVAPK
ncbi:MAG TPA: hypothetical protein VJV03_17340 [Pyrinomonadaceae bacterium]|nr:hypothetical protein [Pyrinomonadaceae bacterium]